MYVKIMRVRNQTTVVLSENAQEVKEDLAPVFGLKNILSAGLILFGKLNAEQQKAIIAIAIDSKGKPNVSVLKKAVKSAAIRSGVLSEKKKAESSKSG